jgi:hypothetical protein
MVSKKKNYLHNVDNFYNPFDAMSFSYDTCFLCGTKLGNQKTVEHVFPQWLQQSFNLTNQKIHLLNRTKIQYRKLTIPCCKPCNTAYLSTVENIIQQHYKNGFSKFIEIDRFIVYKWITKIFYGLLFKELSLNIDRSDPSRGFITEPELLRDLESLHGFMQSIRVPFEFVGFHPWSIFIVETLTFGDSRDFDYHDEFLTLTFSIRMGEVGIIACLEDNGAQEELFGEYFEQFKGIKLHPTQFDELVAKVIYKRHLMNRIPKYSTFFPKNQGDKVTVVSPSLQGYSTSPIFDEWKQKEYATCLAFLWSRYGMQFNDVFMEPDLVLSNLFNEDGTIRILDTEGNLIESYSKERTPENK